MAVTTINIDSQVLTFADLASFPVSGTVKTIYIAEDTNYQYYWDGSQYVLLTTEIEIPANLTFYATTAPSAIAGYEKLVISIDDPDYDNPAVDVSTGAITGTGQLIAELASDAGIFAGNPGVITISTIGEIRRTAGSGGAEFYFEVYQRDSGGTETLVGTSNKTTTITTNVYQQFQTSALFNNGTWLTTDRVVIKYYADKVGGGSDPTYDFSFGGTNPVRTLFPISAQLLLNVPIAIGITGVTGGTNDFVLKVDSSQKLAQSELKTVGGNSLFGTGDIPVGGGITIGTTAIASGTVNRILFEGAGNVVQQDSTFVWNNTDKRLILGTEAVADANTRLVITGSGSGSSTTTFGLKVHNSTGTNNSLIVRDDGFIGFGALPFSSVFKYRFNLGTNANVGISLVSGTALRIVSVNDAISQANILHINGSALIFEQAGTEYGRIDASEWRFQNRTFNINRNQAGAGETSILNLNNTANQANATLTQTYNISTTTPYVQLKATIGFLNVSASFYNIFVRNKPSSALVEVMRFTGNGNVTIGGVNDNNDNTTKTLIVNNGVAPASNITDSFQQYSADIVAGNAAPHFRTENGSIIKLYQETTGIAAAAFVANTSLIFDDSATYGGYTMGQVVAALKAQGLLA